MRRCCSTCARTGNWASPAWTEPCTSRWGTFRARLAELDPARELVVLCRSGGRSGQVARYLQQQGFSSVWNLAGGILAWGQQVDPSLTPY